MAAKKKALAKTGDVLETMAKAGIEVKLTKTEIADYIAEKAQEEINSEIAELRKEIETLAENDKLTPTGPALTIAQGFAALNGDNVADYFVSYQNCYDRYWGMTLFKGTSHYLNVDIKKEQVPQSEIDRCQKILELNKQVQTLNNRLRDLQTKKHRILLIEKILSGTESGKIVLGDLTKLVNKLVKE